ncbi:MAG TPA: SUMF1/EgtB/PvdO family nonheme iron enzyme [Steroidobacteraceae bacterium]|nr:SUMF1/EgtB/PvdO family nonheme iron enzyme [Steroidobacteraceae bacterium]
MEPSLSFDPTIVVRSPQGESRYGARVVIEPATGAMQADHGGDALPSADGTANATLRAVNGRWLLDASPESRVSINAVPVGGARVVIAGDVVTIAGSQLLVEEASPQTLALRRFELEGTETLPPVGDSVQALAPPAEDFDIDMGAVPSIDGVVAPRAAPRAPRSGWNYAAWVMGALLAGVLVVFMMLKPIEIDLKPADSRVKSISGFSWQSASSVFVFPGDHVLRAERKGYEPAQVGVKVGGPMPATVLIHLVKLPGKLKVDSGGVAAEISADGARMGKVPGVVDVPAGDRTLTFKAPRYLDHVERLTIIGGGEKQDLKVALQPNFGVVTVSSQPAGATIEVDGQPAGVTPAKVEMDSGIRRVVLTSPGLRPWTSSIVITAGQPANIGPVTLGAADAHVTVRSVPSGAQVTTGGSFRGITPVTIDLAPGVSHTISVARAGYAPWTRELFAEPDKTSTLDARLAALLVDVRIQGTPEGAEVFLNGESRGKAPVSVQLPAARHKLELRAEGYNPQTSDLVLAPGIARTIDFKLINPKDVAGNSPKVVTTKGGIKLLMITGGTYLAGSDRREQGRRPNEGGHKVTLLRPFYLGEREVTNAQFRQFKESHNSGSVGTFSLDLDKQPVVRVTWNDAAEFCNWLSQQEGLPPAYKPADAGEFSLVVPVNNGYRLPTEAEWEFAARAAATGKPLKYPWGQDLPVQSGTANLAGAEAALVVGAVLEGHRDEFPAVAAPALFAPNAMGFYDLAGNVSEWTNDRYLSFVPSTASTDPLGPDDGKNHTYRGSNWRSSTTVELRFPWREGAADASDVIGFRVARYVAPE